MEAAIVATAMVSFRGVLLMQLVFFGGTYLLIRWLAPYLIHMSDRLLTVASASVMAMIIC